MQSSIPYHEHGSWKTLLHSVRNPFGLHDNTSRAPPCQQQFYEVVSDSTYAFNTSAAFSSDSNPPSRQHQQNTLLSSTVVNSGMTFLMKNEATCNTTICGTGYSNNRLNVTELVAMRLIHHHSAGSLPPLHQLLAVDNHPPMASIVRWLVRTGSYTSKTYNSLISYTVSHLGGKATHQYNSFSAPLQLQCFMHPLCN